MVTGDEVEADGTGTEMADDAGAETDAFSAELEIESIISEVVAEAEAPGAVVELWPSWPIPSEREMSIRPCLDSVWATDEAMNPETGSGLWGLVVGKADAAPTSYQP